MMMKMMKSLSVCRWICALSLVLLILCSETQADSTGQFVPCCTRTSSARIQVVRECREQKPRRGCIHAFQIKNKKGRWCISPDAAWLKARIESGTLSCPPDISM